MKLFLLSFLIILTSNLFGQNTQFEEQEIVLVSYLEAIRSAASDEERDQQSDLLREEFINLLNTEGSFKYDFSKLDKYMSNLIAADKKVRIYNWNVSHTDHTNNYFAFVQTYDKKTKTSQWFELVEFKNHRDNVENKYLKPEKWLGAIYYKIIPVKKGKKTTYTLLGWSALDKLIQQKTIEVVSINSGKLRLGAPIFKTNKGTQKRMIIKYSSDVKVSLKWREKENRIVFDHVVPRDPAMTGAYAFYGPDLSFDAFNLVKSKWVLEINVDVRMGKNENIYHDPNPRRRRKNR